MNWLFQLFSPSRSVETEILKGLPEVIRLEFRAEFDDDNNPIIFISSPDYPGLISEATEFKQAVDNACDAILTYFNVPRECAKLVDYRLQRVEEPQTLLREDHEVGLKEVTLNRHTLAHA